MEKYLLAGAVEHPIYEGFYSVSRDARFVINRDSRVIDTVVDVCLLPRVPSDNETYVKIYDPDIKDTLNLHRLVATLFRPCPGRQEDYIVNHLDGIKCHNWASNLEWTTFSGNSIHAYESGLRSDNKYVLLKDLEDDNISEFYSLNACARYLEVNPSILHTYLNGQKDGPICNKYVAIYKGCEWPPLTSKDIGGHRNGLPKDIIYITPEGKRVICGSVGVAARLLDVKAHNIYGYLNKNSKQFILPGYEIMYLSDYKGIVKDVEQRISNPTRKPYTPRRKAVPIKVTNLTTGAVRNWESVGAFAKSQSVKRNTVQKRMNVTNGRWNGFKIEYLK